MLNPYCSAGMHRFAFNGLFTVMLSVAVLGCAHRPISKTSNSEAYDQMRVQAFEMGRAFEMERHASLIVDYERPNGIRMRIPGQSPFQIDSDEGLGDAIARSTPKKDFAVVIIGKPARYELPEPQLRSKVDQIEAVLKAQGFARIVFQLVSASGRPIYRE